jgi:hypothetical protein
MSLCAASVTKSWVEGVTPNSEFTPVFSPTDWARAGGAILKHKIAIANVLMEVSSKFIGGTEPAKSWFLGAGGDAAMTPLMVSRMSAAEESTRAAGGRYGRAADI